MQTFSILRSLALALKTDLIKYFKYTLLDKIINKLIWASSMLIISTYILPQLGIQSSYGAFIAAGIIVSVAFWDAWGVSVQFVSDLDNNKIIQYYATLPYPASLFFVKQILFYTIRSMIPALVILPTAKLILLDHLDLSHLNILYFISIFIVANVFCATLSLLMTSLVNSMNSIDNISIRFLFPMWFFGGSQFSWQTFHAVSPIFSYISLCNPLLYAMEATRASVLGTEGYLPFWSCIVVLTVFSMLFAYIGSRRLMQRLDCIR